MAIKARFTGKGTEFLNGVPARNLSEEEYAALDTETRKLVRNSSLYDMASEKSADDKAAQS